MTRIYTENRYADVAHAVAEEIGKAGWALNGEPYNLVDKDDVLWISERALRGQDLSDIEWHDEDKAA